MKKQITVKVEQADYVLLRNEAIRTGKSINSLLYGALSQKLTDLRSRGKK